VKAAFAPAMEKLVARKLPTETRPYSVIVRVGKQTRGGKKEEPSRGGRHVRGREWGADIWGAPYSPAFSCHGVRPLVFG